MKTTKIMKISLTKELIRTKKIPATPIRAKATRVNLWNMPSATVVPFLILRLHTNVTVRKTITGNTSAAKKIMKRIEFFYSNSLMIS